MLIGTVISFLLKQFYAALYQLHFIQAFEITLFSVHSAQMC